MAVTSQTSGLRPRVSNENWDAMKMLAKAKARGYPSAERGPRRDEEIAYWRARAEAEAVSVGEEAEQ
jgi:hypothetical protein